MPKLTYRLRRRPGPAVQTPEGEPPNRQLDVHMIGSVSSLAAATLVPRIIAGVEKAGPRDIASSSSRRHVIPAMKGYRHLRLTRRSP